MRRMVPTQIGGAPAVTLMAGRFPVRTVARDAQGRLIQFDWRPWLRAAVRTAWRSGIITTTRSLTVVRPDGSLWHACLRRTLDGRLELDIAGYQAAGGLS